MRGWTPQGRLLLVERITEQGWTVTQAAQAGGLSTSTTGLRALSPRRCGRAGRPQLGATALQEAHFG